MIGPAGFMAAPNNTPEKCILECVGADNRKHRYVVGENATVCGMKIKHKGMLSDDWQRYGCYECDAVIDA